MRANQAYSNGDAETLQRLLDDQFEINAATSGAGVAEADIATLQRVLRQIQHAERDIAALNREQEKLLGSEVGQIYVDAEAALREDRDLLDELAASLQERIAEAQYRLEFVERSVNALGR
jgi:ABC-type nitrate/sulfonate/bicarbonate transport system substrate-binding protein